MNTLLFISFDPGVRSAFTKNAAQKVSQFDLFLQDCEEDGGIDVVRSLKNFTTRKPLQSDYNLVILTEAQNLTPEAQNAVLKILEEPPEFTQIILTASNSSTLLPTVLSRCQIQEEVDIKSPESLDIDWETIKTALGGTDSERLKIADSLDWDKWLQSWQKILIQKSNGTISDSNSLKNLSSNSISQYLKKLLSLTKMKEEHANIKLVTQVALLSCPKIKS